jgi:hypothetical protein
MNVVELNAVTHSRASQALGFFVIGLAGFEIPASRENLTKPDISTGREQISNARTTAHEQSGDRLMNADAQGKIGEVGLPATSQDLPFAAGSR